MSKTIYDGDNLSELSTISESGVTNAALKLSYLFRNSEFNTEFEILERKHKKIQKEKFLLMKTFSKSKEFKRIHKLQESETLIRNNAKNLNSKVSPSSQVNDKDYVFINFILENLPKGLVGLLLAVIISAAMSSTSSEINALATTTSIDILKRNFSYVNDDNIVFFTKLMTLFWGLCAIAIACVAYLADNLIQLVNIIGSIFYGNVLGIFLIAFFLKALKSNAVFIGAIITQIIIIIAWYYDWMPFLWLNVFGCVMVILISFIIHLTLKGFKAS